MLHINSYGLNLLYNIHDVIYTHIFVKYTQKGISFFSVFAGYGHTIQTIPYRSYTAEWNKVYTVTHRTIHNSFLITKLITLHIAYHPLHE